MLSGINPLLTGELLRHLDEMGHSDAVVIADAHFPASRLARRLVTLPGTRVSDVVAAVREVLPLDIAPAVDLMATETGELLPAQEVILASAAMDPGAYRELGRTEFYTEAASAFVVVRTTDVQVYANVILRKGIVR